VFRSTGQLTWGETLTCERVPVGHKPGFELIRPQPEPNVVRWVDRADEELLFLSVITLGEMRKGVMRLDSGKRRRRLEAWLEQDLPLRFEGRVLVVGREVADRWGTLSAVAAARGTSLPVIDGLLAATALQHNLTFVTRNTADVEATGVRVLNPWLPE
jgi:toxin FitB